MDRISRAIEDLRQAFDHALLGDLELYVERGELQMLDRLGLDDGTLQNYWSRLADALAEPDAFAERDRRLLRALGKIGAHRDISIWLEGRLLAQDGEARLSPVLDALASVGVQRSVLCRILLERVPPLDAAGHPTAAGRYLLAAPANVLRQAIASRGDLLSDCHASIALTQLVTSAGLERLPDLIDALLTRDARCLPPQKVLHLLLNRAPEYEPQIVAAFDREENGWAKFQQGQALFAHDAGRHRSRLFQGAVAALWAPARSSRHDVAGVVLVEEFGREAIGELVRFFRGQADIAGYQCRKILEAAGALGVEAVPIFRALAERGDTASLSGAVSHLRALGLPTLDAEIAGYEERSAQIEATRRAEAAAALVAQERADIPYGESDEYGHVYPSRPADERTARAALDKRFASITLSYLASFARYLLSHRILGYLTDERGADWLVLRKLEVGNPSWYYLGRPCTDAEIDRAFSEQGIEAPLELREFFRAFGELRNYPPDGAGDYSLPSASSRDELSDWEEPTSELLQVPDWMEQSFVVYREYTGGLVLYWQARLAYLDHDSGELTEIGTFAEMIGHAARQSIS